MHILGFHRQFLHFLLQVHTVNSRKLEQDKKTLLSEQHCLVNNNDQLRIPSPPPSPHNTDMVQHSPSRYSGLPDTHYLLDGLFVRCNSDWKHL